LVLLHGSGANAAMWMSEIETWAKSFRVFAIDIIGEPGVSAASRPALDTDAHALWLGDVLQKLGLARASIVGISLGGWLAIDFAARHPDRVVCLVVLCPSGIGRQRVSFIFKAMTLKFLGRAGRRRMLALLAGRTPPQQASHNSRVAAMMTVIFKHFRYRREKVPLFSDD